MIPVRMKTVTKERTKGMTEAELTTGSGAGRAAYWRELSEAWEASGQTQMAFCRQRQVNPGTFAWWRGELARRARGEAGPRRGGTPRSRFVEVRVGRERIGGYELILANGRRIVVRGDFEDAALRRLISVVEGSGC
jgi:hypothetical protein